MFEPAGSIRGRRPALQRAFQHLEDLAAATDLSEAVDDDDRDLQIARHVVPHYGEVGRRPDLSRATFTDVAADGVPATWLSLRDSVSRDRVVYFHGGGWRSGAARDYRAVLAMLAEYSGASIMAVDYRLAPEHRFPAGLDDCVAAYRWALEHGPDGSGVSPAERIHLVGDSAGGNLAVATCLRLAQLGARMPDRLAVIAGSLDNVEEQRRVGIDDPICTLQQFRICNAMYLSEGHDPHDPLVSPVYAPVELLAAFPPTLLQASWIESFAWDSKLFAERLGEAGVRVNLSLWPELPHVWHQFLELFPEARSAIREIADHLRRVATPSAEVEETDGHYQSC